MKQLFFILLIGCFSKSFAQTDYTFVYNNDAIIKKGNELHDAEKYTEAIKEYDKITTTDPKYLEAQYEKALTISALGNKENTKAFFQDLYKKNLMPEFPILYTAYGSFLSDNDEFDESEKIFKEGEKYLSNHSNFQYNVALLYIRKKEQQKSIDILEKIISKNPNHASSHYLLGLLAFENGRITEGTLALLSYLIIAPSGRFAEDAILKLNKKFGENFLEKSKLVFSKSGDNFEEIETILRNQLPLKSAYKVKSDIDDVIIRQVQAVAEYAVDHKMENGFFETTYIPWISDIIKKKQFEPFSYYILIGMEEKLGKKITSQKKKITSFYENYILKDFWPLYAKRKLEHFGKEQEVIVMLEDGNPYLVGAQVNGKKEGRYKLLDKYGNLSGDLNVKNDVLDGVQKYFDAKGNMTFEKNFVASKLQGKTTEYFSNGNINSVRFYKEDVLNGLSTSYYINGGKQCEVNFENGERNGKLICLYENGNKKSESNYVKGKLQGVYIEYNEIGAITGNYNYLDDQLNGAYVQYFDGKVIKAQATYVNGKVQGSFKNYFSNGVLESEYVYEAGKIRKTINYFANKNKSSEVISNEKEEIESINYYDSKGVLFYVEKFKGGELKTAQQYNKNNPKPTEINLNKTFIMNSMDGKLIISGEYEKAKKNKEWKYYFSSGILRLSENYTQGKLNGICKDYQRNGDINSIRNYTNDTINGVYEVYENGKLDRVFAYSKGEQNGPFKSFYKDGTTSTEGYIVDGEVSYEKLTHWQNGAISNRDKYVDGVIVSAITYNTKGEQENSVDYKNKTGKFTQTNNNGATIQTTELVNGELNGKYTLKDKLNNPIIESEYISGSRYNSYKKYSPLGTIYIESNYYDGKLNGVDKQYDLVGNVRLVDENYFGDEHGKTTRYYHNKSKYCEFYQMDGVTDGEYNYYNQKGESILILGYQNNALKYYIKKSKTGEVNEKVDIVDETATIKSLYPNGKTAISMNFVKGNKEGKQMISGAEGNPEIEINFTKNILNGARIEYYSNGKVYRKEKFVNDSFEGPQEYFKEDGKPWLTVNYKNDEMHGDALIYKDGKLVITKKYDSNELVDIK